MSCQQATNAAGFLCNRPPPQHKFGRNITGKMLCITFRRLQRALPRRHHPGGGLLGALSRVLFYLE